MYSPIQLKKQQLFFRRDPERLDNCFFHHFPILVKMSILVLGGRGKTSSRVSRLLAQANIPFIVASRTVSDKVPYHQSQFDWNDKTTYPKLFADAKAKTGKPVSAVYLVASMDPNTPEQLKDFIDLAVKENVKRIVLLSASTIEKGGPVMGQGHEYLVKLHEEIGLEYTVLRPTWFQGLSDRFFFFFFFWLEEWKLTR